MSKPPPTDGVIFLRPLTIADAPAHLAGEDDAIAKWLSGGRSSIATVEAYIVSCEKDWRTNGPRRAFGIFDCATEVLIGSIEANLAYRLVPGDVNVSYGVFVEWRGRGIARRALDLMGSYLKNQAQVQQMIVRVVPANVASVRVLEKSGFQFLGIFDEPKGSMARYFRSL